jgi:hypothetical protein
MIFEKLFSKENKKDEIVDVKLSDKEFNEAQNKIKCGGCNQLNKERIFQC